MTKYQIITDATIDLSGEFVKENGIAVIPMNVTIDEKEYSYIFEDGQITSETFFNLIKEGKQARTSQINQKTYSDFFEEYLKKDIDILYICFSSGLSGTLQTANIAITDLKEKYPNRNILCVDSLCASAGEGLLVYSAAQKQKQGMDIHELYSWVEQNKLKVIHWFTVEDLAHLHRGGRISAATAIVGGALQIKPIMHVNDTGHLENVDKVRGRGHSLMALLDKMKDEYDPNGDDTVFICHGDCFDEAKGLAEAVKAEFCQADVKIFHMGPIIGTHTGAGVMAIFFWGSER